MRDINAYMQRRRIANRRFALQYLGGKCVKCGRTKDLEFDHIDPATKTRTIADMSSYSRTSLIKELDKCQLLCPKHHRQKTRENREHAGGHNKWSDVQHGKLHAYITYKCRCDPCKAAKSEQSRRLSAKV